MLKIKINKLKIRDTKEEGYIIEHEFNKIEDRLIFPVYAVNNFVEAIELIQEDEDYYILKPCIFNEGEDVNITDYCAMEDFKDILDAVNTFMEFNINDILEIEEDSLKEFIIEFLKNSSIYVNEVDNSSVLIDFINSIAIKLNISVLDYQICFDMQVINSDNNTILVDNMTSFSINHMIEEEDLEYFMEGLDNEDLKANILNNL